MRLLVGSGRTHWAKEETRFIIFAILVMLPVPPPPPPSPEIKKKQMPHSLAFNFLRDDFKT